MESLDSCVQNLDMRSMPQFLDQVSDERENEASRHFAISLYAELARMHKQAVIPFIPRMMASIVRSLPFSADSQQLHEACSKVVTSVARLESAAAGAAICLQALVESEKWKFAPSDLQKIICTKATAALVEQGTQAVIFLHLVKSLAKFCKEASKEHVAEWLGVGLQVLQRDTAQWQKRLAAAQLITIILKTADADNLGIDLPSIVKILEVCMLDKVTVVQTAVAEAFDTAKGVGLEKHLLSAGNNKNFTPGKNGSIDMICESQRRFLDTEVSGMQDLSSPGSSTSGASSYESVPSMASSTVKFGSEPKRSKQQGKNMSYLSHLNGSLTRTSMLKENTPATIPRRVLSEIPTSGKRLSNSDSLPSSWEATSLRRSSMDVGNKEISYSMRSQDFLGPRKFVQHVRAPAHDDAQRTVSLSKKRVDGCLNASNTEDRHNADWEKKESVPCESMAGGNSSRKEATKTAEEGNERGKKNAKISPEGSLPKRECMQANSSTSESDGADVGCADGGFLSKDPSMEARSNESTLPGERSHHKASNSDNPPQDFDFRAPCDLLHSIQRMGSTKDIRQSGKGFSDCENKAPSGVSWTSDSLASCDSEEDRSVFVNLHNRDATVDANCCRSKLAGVRQMTLRAVVLGVTGHLLGKAQTEKLTTILRQGICMSTASHINAVRGVTQKEIVLLIVKASPNFLHGQASDQKSCKTMVEKLVFQS
ncbi:hypothetical protein GOP47_0027111 [Adiantum capillus-veneris]|nr:hypothetical protein GOP47_0027111 [Adiantum capillus-veneris]